MEHRMFNESLNEEKFQNAVLYLLQHAPRRPGLTVLLKMLYFADYQHYRTYLSSITGAEYVALPKGPVINEYKQLFDGLVENGILEERKVPVLGVSFPKIAYEPLYEPNTNVFTATELQVLDAVIRECGTATGAALSERTHRDGPWSFAWDPDSPGRPIPYILFRWLDNVPDDEDAELARAQLERPGVAAAVAALQSA